jgi:hypothetical protein
VIGGEKNPLEGEQVNPTLPLVLPEFQRVFDSKQLPDFDVYFLRLYSLPQGKFSVIGSAKKSHSHLRIKEFCASHE